MNTIEDITNPECWVEHDISAELEAEQVKYEREHKDSIKVSVVPEPKFLGSRAEGETEEEHAEREAVWIEEHSCPICEEFSCDGNCEKVMNYE